MVISASGHVVHRDDYKRVLVLCISQQNKQISAQKTFPSPIDLQVPVIPNHALHQRP